MQSYSLNQRLVAEFLGTAFLLAAIVGSGIMAETLSAEAPASKNVALELLCNSTATGAILFVLITMLGPISGAHFNPAVTLAFLMRGEIRSNPAAMYIAAQIVGAAVGVWATHMMFQETVFQLALKARPDATLWFSEGIATFGLVATILLTLRARPEAVPMSVALYVAAAIWFTSSTSFANPAVTFARSLTDTFSGIAPADAPAFIIAQFAAAVAAVAIAGYLEPGPRQEPRNVNEPAE